MGVAHEPWLVVLSIVVAIQGAYVGLCLAVQFGTAVALRRRLLLAAAAVALAVAIWAMHFIAMLAAQLPFPVDYLVFPTLLSLLVCVIVVGVAVFAASAGRLTALRLVASAVFMGGGIATMHYIGMAALHASAHMHHAPIFVTASVAVGIAASGLALWLAVGRGRRPPLILSAAALGMAIAGMHYTAMAGLTLMPFTTMRIAGGPAISTDLLAIVVAVVAFIVSGIFLLALVPERSRPTTQPVDALRNAANATAGTTESLAPGSHAAAPVPPEGKLGLGYGTFAPLGGAGAPPRRMAKQLPVEHDGGTQFVPVDDIVAVHANAHYTHIFDGKAQLFCPLAIGVVESRLDTGRFIRVHRSHIVNIDHIIGLKRSGDTGMLRLAGAEPHMVPVSRSRLGRLKSRLDQRAGAALPGSEEIAPGSPRGLAAQHR